MPTAITWNGTAYSVPNAGELNWATLTNFLVDLGNNAQTTNFQILNARIATSTPVTVAAATDCIVNVNVAGAATVNLPAGSTGQVFYISDSSGAAETNNITIDGDGSENINGSLTYVINTNNGGVMLGWNGSEWRILSEVNLGRYNNSLTVIEPTAGAGADLDLSGNRTADGVVGQLDFVNNGASNAILASVRGTRLTANNSGGLEFHTMSLGTLTKRATIVNNGRFRMNTNGSASEPAYSFETESDVGLYISGTNEMSIATAGTQAAVFTSGQNFGLGSASSPAAKLEVIMPGDTNRAADFQNNSGTVNDIVRIRSGSANDVTGHVLIGFDDLNGRIGSVSAASATQVAYNTSSDKRLKDKITYLKDCLKIVKAVNPASFIWKKTGLPGSGFVAQEVFEVYPEAVRVGSDNVNENPWSVDYGKLTTPLWGAVQELAREVEKIKSIMVMR